ncbi:unnamed protein product [Adineta ricciae]|uniref:Pyrroline-5-carboxylate reductase catalytic N-terminal domain-containing protein n=1 Tax=Adineta ricciae TaxID=249248 RepID=A0A814GYE2_ADIRI|nr:unnamed protein product [Adineta ricciae]
MGNLTAGLESVQLDKICPGGFTHLFTQLRRRSNLITSTHIAYACYFVALLNRIKRAGDKLKSAPGKKRSHRLIAELHRDAGFKIGIIGAGRIGHLLAKFLLQYGDVYPDELYLSSRQADLLTDMIDGGVAFCKFNNAHIVEQCDIVFLCVAPHHIRYVIDDIRDRIKPHVLFYTLILGYPTLKLSSLLQHTHFIKPSYQFNVLVDNDESLWPLANDMETIFGNELLMKRLSLENEDQNDSLVRDDDFVPSLFYALLNIIKQNTTLTRIEALRVVSASLFNNPDLDIILNEFKQSETKKTPTNESFSEFDLVHLQKEATVIRNLLDNNPNLRQLFSDTFISHYTQIKPTHS